MGPLVVASGVIAGTGLGSIIDPGYEERQTGGENVVSRAVSDVKNFWDGIITTGANGISDSIPFLGPAIGGLIQGADEIIGPSGFMGGLQMATNYVGSFVGAKDVEVDSPFFDKVFSALGMGDELDDESAAAMLEQMQEAGYLTPEDVSTLTEQVSSGESTWDDVFSEDFISGFEAYAADPGTEMAIEDSYAGGYITDSLYAARDAGELTDDDLVMVSVMEHDGYLSSDELDSVSAMVDSGEISWEAAMTAMIGDYAMSLENQGIDIDQHLSEMMSQMTGDEYVSSASEVQAASSAEAGPSVDEQVSALRAQNPALTSIEMAAESGELSDAQLSQFQQLAASGQLTEARAEAFMPLVQSGQLSWGDVSDQMALGYKQSGASWGAAQIAGASPTASDEVAHEHTGAVSRGTFLRSSFESAKQASDGLEF